MQKTACHISHCRSMVAEAIAANDPNRAPRNKFQVNNEKARLKRLQFPEDQRSLLEYHAIVFPETLPDCRTYRGRKYAVCCLPQMDQHLKEVMKHSGGVTLNYDTTFNCGKFYVSILSFRHPFFEEEPVIPLAILFHETKKEVGHSMLFSNRKIAIPGLNSEKTVFISDRERSFKNVRSCFFPKSKFAFCHIHILKVSSVRRPFYKF